MDERSEGRKEGLTEGSLGICIRTICTFSSSASFSVYYNYNVCHPARFLKQGHVKPRQPACKPSICFSTTLANILRVEFFSSAAWYGMLVAARCFVLMFTFVRACLEQDMCSTMFKCSLHITRQ